MNIINNNNNNNNKDAKLYIMNLLYTKQISDLNNRCLHEC